MKVLFTSVPQWFPISPYLACAILAGQVEEAGYHARTIDYNIEFFNDILQPAYLEKSLEMAHSFLACPTIECANASDKETFAPRLETIALERQRIIKSYFEQCGDQIKPTIEALPEAVRVLRERDLFYDPEKLYRAKDVIKSALQIASLPYVPARIQIDNYIANPIMTYDFADIDFQCREPALNMFLPYFEKKIACADFSNIDLIGISITDLSQIVPGFTLARLLKEKTNAKICLGGNYVYKIAKELKKIPQVFHDYCDYLLIGDGETNIVELVNFLAGKCSVNAVHSLVYMDAAGTVGSTEPTPALQLDVVAYPNFDTYAFQKYFSPELVIPVQLGKGCYWGKCTFCDFYTGQQKFDLKSVVRAVDEVEFLSKKYHSPFFNFVDECIPPKFYHAFAKEIIKRGIKIYFYSFARLEKGFTKEVLRDLYQAGARFFMWGYEAESERVMGLMNKGIDLKYRKQILTDAMDVGLWNLCTFLLGYPSETPEELQATIDTIYNEKLVDTCTPSNFALKKNAILKDHMEDAKITDFQPNGELHISYKYHSSVTTMEEIKRRRNAFEKQFLIDSAKKLFPHTFTESDYLLMYLARYGRDYVKNYRLIYQKQLPIF